MIEPARVGAAARADGPQTQAQGEAMSALKRIACWILDHEGRVLGGDYHRNMLLMHLHAYAGLLCVCNRCGAVWDDTPNNDGPIMRDMRGSLPRAKATP